MAYVPSHSGGLAVVDASDPRSPHTVTEHSPERELRDVAIDGANAFVRTTNSVHMLDMSVPGEPA